MQKSLFGLITTSALLLGGAAHAATFTVNANNNGFFGHLQSGGTDMVQGSTLSAGDQVVISATGVIGLGGSITTDADGIDLDSSTGLVSAFEFTPLEEAAIDAGGPNGTLMPALGALIGAFVSLTDFNNPAFLARDSDLSANGIDAADLFLIGTSLTFTAATDGVLFFGINEGWVSNNSGGFSVDVSPAAVPLPAGLPLLLGGLGALGVARRRKPHST